MQNAEVRDKIFDLSQRTKKFALRIIKLFQALPKTVEAQVIGKQILRCGTSVGAQYREAKRARSKAEFLSKIESALQELEESGYWMEILVEARIVSMEKLKSLSQEQDELTAILVSTINTAKANK
jgi:four helix bundle protein